MGTVLKGWWDAGDSSTLYVDAGITPVSLDSDVAQQANDKSGNNNHLTQATLSRRPVYKTNVVNGLSALRFDAAQALSKSGAVNTAIDDYCIVAVSKAINHTGTHVVFNSGSGTTNGISLVHRTTGLKKGMFIPGTGYVNSESDPDTILRIYVMWRTSGTTYLYQNGGISIVESAGIPVTPTAAAMGAFGTSASGSFDGYICEVCYLAGPNQEQINTLGDYLADKWGAIWVDIIGQEGDEEPPALQLAFPEALGFGAYAQGGRGGSVIEVTNLNNSGAGSFRTAVTASGPRTVVFRVGGTIQLDIGIFVDNPFLTIAGQTAPGGGICLKMNPTFQGTSSPLNIRTHDVIVRYLRIRPGGGVPPGNGPETDAITITSDEGHLAHDIIIDHCSLSWCVDKSFETNGPWDAVPEVPRSYNITFQNSVVAEALHHSSHSEGGHSKGSTLLHVERLSIIRSIYALNQDRNPLFHHQEIAEMVNCLIYINNHGWANVTKLENHRVDSGEFQGINFIRNHWIYGADANPDETEIVKQITPLDPDPTSDLQIYLYENIGPHRPDHSYPQNSLYGELLDQTIVSTTHYLVDTKHPTLAMDTWLAEDVPDLLMPIAGAYRRLLEDGTWTDARDSVDTRILAHVVAGTGAIIDHVDEVGGWPTLDAGTPYTDSDNDGMPDVWETAQGLNPNDASDRNGDAGATGYTNLERFLNGS